MKEKTIDEDDLLLSMEHLNFIFKTQRGIVRAVRDLSLTLRRGQTLTL
ncbi:MAG: hypothetical protein PF495_08605 [Spirochaetales bacterium]|jgi:ABC-type dipeptide/oligopeptide/nickel transport system ATPase component|nr:hypothetical protein [Spirochaetales bacterium]